MSKVVEIEVEMEMEMERDWVTQMGVTDEIS
jgi:hypothetical protein